MTIKSYLSKLQVAPGINEQTFQSRRDEKIEREVNAIWRSSPQAPISFYASCPYLLAILTTSTAFYLPCSYSVPSANNLPSSGIPYLANPT